MKFINYGRGLIHSLKIQDFFLHEKWCWCTILLAILWTVRFAAKIRMKSIIRSEPNCQFVEMGTISMINFFRKITLPQFVATFSSLHTDWYKDGAFGSSKTTNFFTAISLSLFLCATVQVFKQIFIRPLQ